MAGKHHRWWTIFRGWMKRTRFRQLQRPIALFYRGEERVDRQRDIFPTKRFHNVTLYICIPLVPINFSNIFLYSKKIRVRRGDEKHIRIYRVFRNLWGKKIHINTCPICLRLWDIMNSINRENSSKLVLPGMVYSIFIIIVIGIKKTHTLLCIRDIDISLV